MAVEVWDFGLGVGLSGEPDEKPLPDLDVWVLWNHESKRLGSA